MLSENSLNLKKINNYSNIFSESKIPIYEKIKARNLNHVLIKRNPSNNQDKYSLNTKNYSSFHNFLNRPLQKKLLSDETTISNNKQDTSNLNYNYNTGNNSFNTPHNQNTKLNLHLDYGNTNGRTQLSSNSLIIKDGKYFF
jgi:hypothetical protein